MRIDVQKLQAGPETHILNHNPAFFDLVGKDCEVSEKVKGKVTFSLVGDKVLMEGNIQTSARMECVRCLAPVKIPIRKSFTMVFIPKEEEPSQKESFNPEEENTSYYTGKTIYPDMEIRDLVLLEIPDYPLCREDCPGLCVHCGANLNNGTCRCKEMEEVAPPNRPAHSWKEQLKHLRKTTEGK